MREKIASILGILTSGRKNKQSINEADVATEVVEDPPIPA
jgi:hypothetical protein